MNSFQSIMKWINSEKSPITIRNNESFSLPFLYFSSNNAMMAVFSYSSVFRFGDEVTSFYIGNLYVINPIDPRKIEVIPINNEVPKKSTKIFDSTPTVSKRANNYSRLIELSDALLNANDDVAAFANEYAQLFNAYVPESLNSTYDQFGHTYFSLIKSYL